MIRKLLVTTMVSACFISVNAQKFTVIDRYPIIDEIVADPEMDFGQAAYKGETYEYDKYYTRRSGLMVDSIAVIIPVPGGGFGTARFKPSGTNRKDDIYFWKEIGNYYPFHGQATMKGVRLIYKKYIIREGSDNYDITLYNAPGADHLPTDIYANRSFTGDVVTVGDKPDEFTYIQFKASDFTNITTNFVVSVAIDEVTPFGDEPDQIELYSSVKGDGKNEMNAMVKITSGSAIATSTQDIWVPMDKMFQGSDGNPMIFDYDFMIIPVLDVDFMSADYVDLKGVQFKGHYPNPANDFFNVQLEITEPQNNTTISLQMINGQVLKEVNTGMLTPGSHSIKVDVSDLPAGLYIYTFTSDNAMLSAEVVVTK